MYHYGYAGNKKMMHFKNENNPFWSDTVNMQKVGEIP